jgi:hypothetical protein
MLKEDWVEAIKNALSPSAFRDVGVAALCALYQFPVRLADGAGDGGVDAWLALPSGQVPVQFYAGRAEPWEAKLERDLGRAVEAMRSEGLVVVTDGKAAASAELAKMTAAAIALQQGAAERLREACVAALEKRVHAADRRRALVDDIFPDLGVLVREGLADMLPGRSADAVARRLNALERRVTAHLKPSGGDAGEAVRALVEVVAASPYGRALGTAELFMHMSERESTHLATALTARPILEVWLDASVALPMLCGKHDRVVRRWPTSEIAVELHAALVSRKVRLVVPSAYVEEMAAHLIDAARRYRPLVGADPALARSENYFVAHSTPRCCSTRSRSSVPTGRRGGSRRCRSWPRRSATGRSPRAPPSGTCSPSCATPS